MATVQEQTAQFLMQATLGADFATLEQVRNQGLENWLNQQLNHRYTTADSFQQKTDEIWQDFRARLLARVGGNSQLLDGNGNPAALPYWFYWRMAWWHKTLTANPESLLRQRVAQALSEIIVISDNSNLELDAVGMASFYDILYRHAFGNYTDLLTEVSLHPCMGAYLTHINNQKADPSRNIHPDENYAREIMQLFTIGLFGLNPDGSRKQDAKGKDIPTYNNNDIKQLARVFTGLHASRYLYEWPDFNVAFAPYNGLPVSFDDGTQRTYKTVPFVDMVTPMVADEDYHDQGSKVLLQGRINIPAGQSTRKDIQDVVQQLVAHPNTAPFLATRLLQQLITSNPSPRYVRDVAAAFGQQGNLKAMLRAIFLHPEARQGTKLKSPMLRATQILRGLQAQNDSGKLWLLGERFKGAVDQHVLSSPTVFNFYLPDYAPHGPIEDQDQVAPEFQLHTANNAVNYANLMYHWFFSNSLPAVSTTLHATDNTLPEVDPERLTNPADKLKLNLRFEEQLAAEGRYDELIERLSLLLTGKHRLSIHAEIRQAFMPFINISSESPQWVVQTILFMITISPEFAVLGGA